MVCTLPELRVNGVAMTAGAELTETRRGTGVRGGNGAMISAGAEWRAISDGDSAAVGVRGERRRAAAVFPEELRKMRGVVGAASGSSLTRRRDGDGSSSAALGRLREADDIFA
jgi:hypothetical protein